MSKPELNSRTIKLQLPSKETLIKGTKLGGFAGTIAAAIYLITLLESQLTPKTNLRIDSLQGEVTALQISLVEKTKGITSEPRLLELEGKTKLLARDLDSKASANDILQMELRIYAKMDEHREKSYEDLKELFRLFAQKQKQNGRAE